MMTFVNKSLLLSLYGLFMAVWRASPAEECPPLTVLGGGMLEESLTIFINVSHFLSIPLEAIRLTNREARININKDRELVEDVFPGLKLSDNTAQIMVYRLGTNSFDIDYVSIAPSMDSIIHYNREKHTETEIKLLRVNGEPHSVLNLMLIPSRFEGEVIVFYIPKEEKNELYWSQFAYYDHGTPIKYYNDMDRATNLRQLHDPYKICYDLTRKGYYTRFTIYKCRYSAVNLFKNHYKIIRIQSKIYLVGEEWVIGWYEQGLYDTARFKPPKSNTATTKLFRKEDDYQYNIAPLIIKKYKFNDFFVCGDAINREKIDPTTDGPTVPKSSATRRITSTKSVSVTNQTTEHDIFEEDDDENKLLMMGAIFASLLFCISLLLAVGYFFGGQDNGKSSRSLGPYTQPEPQYRPWAPTWPDAKKSNKGHKKSHKKNNNKGAKSAKSIQRQRSKSKANSKPCSSKYISQMRSSDIRSRLTYLKEKIYL